MSPRRLALVLACVPLLVGACRSWIGSDEMPELPIAISYRTPEESRRNAEALIRQLGEQAGIGSQPARATPGEARAGVDEVGSYFSHLLGVPTVDGDSFQPRLALFDPHSGDITLVESALRGSVPLDWSADHERLLFAQPEGRAYQIYEFHRIHGTVRQVTRGPFAHSQACYGAQERIVVTQVDVRKKEPESRIAISQAGGRRPYIVLSSGPTDFSPTCAPDGSALAFVRRDERGRELLLVRSPVVTDGEWSESERSIGPGRHPSFSPDSEWLVFSAPQKREWRLWRSRPDGSGRARVGNSVRPELHPSMSPDGRLVLYVSTEEQPKSHLYLRRFDGSGDRMLFRDGDAEFPVW